MKPLRCKDLQRMKETEKQRRGGEEKKRKGFKITEDENGHYI